MRSSRDGKSKIIIGILAAALLIAAFGVGMYLMEKRGVIDEQFGDTGDWGSDDAEEILDTLDDMEYTSTDRSIRLP